MSGPFEKEAKLFFDEVMQTGDVAGAFKKHFDFDVEHLGEHATRFVFSMGYGRLVQTTQAADKRFCHETRARLRLLPFPIDVASIVCLYVAMPFPARPVKFHKWRYCDVLTVDIVG